MNEHSLKHEELTVVPLPHPWRWIAVGAVTVLLAMFIYGVVGNEKLQWPVVGRYLFAPVILKGLWYTIIITFLVMLFATIIGTLAAIMMLSPSRLLSVPATLFVWFFRGAPALVQLILWYNLSLVVQNFALWIPGVGVIFSIPTNDVMTPFVTAIVAFSLHESGYMAEIVRNGINSVNKGQTEAALSLGMKPSLLLRRIIIPQAMRVIIPPTGNEAIGLLKGTSLVSVVAVGELLYSAQSIYARTFETIPLLLVVTFWYLVVVSIMSVGQHHLERYFSRDESRARRGLIKFIAGNAFGIVRKVSP